MSGSGFCASQALRTPGAGSPPRRRRRSRRSPRESGAACPPGTAPRRWPAASRPPRRRCSRRRRRVPDLRIVDDRLEHIGGAFRVADQHQARRAGPRSMAMTAVADLARVVGEPDRASTLIGAGRSRTCAGVRRPCPAAAATARSSRSRCPAPPPRPGAGWKDRAAPAGRCVPARCRAASALRRRPMVGDLAGPGLRARRSRFRGSVRACRHPGLRRRHQDQRRRVGGERHERRVRTAGQRQTQRNDDASLALLNSSSCHVFRSDCHAAAQASVGDGTKPVSGSLRSRDR